MKSFNINIASQGKQRKLAKAWTGDDIETHSVPFRFQRKDKRGLFEIKEAPWGYILDLPTHILGYLDCLHE